MIIQNSSKQVLEALLDKAIENGSLEPFFVRYDALAKSLDLESENVCRICFQYMHELGYINVIRNDNGARLIELKAKGIDFLESEK